MKRSLIPVSWIGAVVVLVLQACAEDYRSAHYVEPGDVISAEVINELFDKIAESEKTITADSLLGTWKGASFGPYSAYGTPNWFNDPTNLCWSLTNITVTFSKLAANHYIITTSAPDPFASNNTASRSNRISVIEGTLFGIGSQVNYTIDRVGPTRIRLTSHNIWDEYPKLLTLDRQNNPPEKPKLLSADAQKNKVVLAWQDNSNDETGFHILRRDGLSNEYISVAFVSANATAWTNNAVSSGIYWFRIAATNANGSSLGSNVKRVSVP